MEAYQHLGDILEAPFFYFFPSLCGQERRSGVGFRVVRSWAVSWSLCFLKELGLIWIVNQTFCQGHSSAPLQQAMKDMPHGSKKKAGLSSITPSYFWCNLSALRIFWLKVCDGWLYVSTWIGHASQFLVKRQSRCCCESIFFDGINS